MVWAPARLAVLTLLLLPSLFPGAPAEPLTWVTAPPERVEYTLPSETGLVEIDVYRPPGASPRGGILLLLGARPVPRRDPLLVRFSEGLARTGLVVLVPEPPNLLEGRVLPEERATLAQLYDLLLLQPGVDPRRSGFVGFSVGGGLSVIAATDPRIRDRVRFVNSLGGYFDALELLQDVATRSIVVDGQVQPWEPSALSWQVVALQVVESMADPNDEQVLRRAFLETQEVPEEQWRTLSPAGSAARALLDGSLTQDRPGAAQAIAALPQRARDRLTAISPSQFLPDLRARLYLMHDRGDSLIPFTQSIRMARQRPDIVARFTLFSIFEHVIPDRPQPIQTFLPDLWALYWHLHAVLLETQ